MDTDRLVSPRTPLENSGRSSTAGYHSWHQANSAPCTFRQWQQSLFPARAVLTSSPGKHINMSAMGIGHTGFRIKEKNCKFLYVTFILQVDISFDAVSTGVAICSPSVPGLFADNFDCQTMQVSNQYCTVHSSIAS